MIALAAFKYMHHSIWIRERQRRENNRLGNAVDRRVRPDREREHPDDH
jgi:hypothetical protein